MATLDIFILVVLAIGLLRGIKTGFLKQAASLIGTILSFVLAASFMEAGGKVFEANFGMDPGFGPILAFVAIFMVVKIAVHTIARTAEALLDTANLTGIDRLAGGVAGGLKAAIAMSLVFLMIGYAQLPSQISREASDFYAPVYRLVPDAWRYLSDRAPAFENFRQEVEDRLEMGMDSIPI